jgi:DNA helicase IV
MGEAISATTTIAEEMVAVKTELDQEQSYLSMLYDRLDTLRERARGRLADALGQPADGGPRHARVDRDALVGRHADRLARLSSAESGLCFGRLDMADGTRRYVGRLGILDDDREPLLIDWRAPAAQAFYRATPAEPFGVVRRRHLRTRGRKVVAFEDDVLDLDALSDDERADLSGEAALLAALNANRTGSMADIVATIQAEQDRIIRSDLAGVLVVQGGPGTGKTAVALHRAAYLLYTHRERLAGRGVLVVGPNPVFLRYIEQVLPSLGETGVLLATVGELFPGVRPTGSEPLETAALKGDARMAEVLAAAVRDHQRVPDDDLELRFDGHPLRLERRTCERARRRSQRLGIPHNLARPVFQGELLEELSRQVVARLTGDLPEVDLPDDDLIGEDIPAERLLEGELGEIRSELAATPEVRAALDQMWPHLTPQQLVGRLLSSRELLEAAAPELAPEERALLLRKTPEPRSRRGAGWWTPADVPLLDEAATLLGEDGRDEAGATRRRRRRQRERERELSFARGVLDNVGVDDHGLVDPAVLVARHHDRGPVTSIARQARQDRSWTFGHVIVDEAQEVSAMAWRLLMRRCPGRSMTVSGDTAQRGSLWGVSSWAEVLEPHAQGRWRVEELTVNYRTPVEIVAVAADVLASLSAELRPPRSVRESGVEPWALRVDEHDLAARLAEVAAEQSAAVAGGKLAVLVPFSRAAGLAAAIGAVLPAAGIERGPELLSAPVAVLAVSDAKGLEFDAVLVVDPDAILDQSPRGASDLYVALTRATQRLGVVHTGELPPVLRRLRRLDDLSPGPAGRSDVGSTTVSGSASW